MGDDMNNPDLKRKYSPMIRQYLTIKEQYPDSFVFYRVGDFYELFFNDAILGARELDIALTGKDAGVKERVPMAGVPYHAVDGYLNILTKKGYKIVIVEQMNENDETTLVKRNVSRIITPGTILSDAALDAKTNNYLASLTVSNDEYILSYLDLSTGEAYLTHIPLVEGILFAEICKLGTKEIIVPGNFKKDFFKNLSKNYNFTLSYEDDFQIPAYLSYLSADLTKEETENYARLLNYIIKTQMRTLIHLQKVKKYDLDNYLRIDQASRKNLEITETLRFQDKKNTLLHLLDKCVTAMGSRYLKKTLLYPLIDRNEIEERHTIVGKMIKAYIDSSDLRKELNEIYDLERLAGRIACDMAGPKDLLMLEKSLKNIEKIRDLCKKIGIASYFNLDEDLKTYLEIYNFIFDSVDADAPFLIKDGNVIKEGYSVKLDEMRSDLKSAKDYLLQLEASEKERTGIKTLKVGYNKVFGYYIEVSKMQSKLVQDEFGYIRKQTLANAERYITQELKEKEAIILRLGDAILNLEKTLFSAIRNKLKEKTGTLQHLANIIALLDMLLAFAKVSAENKYVRPTLNADGILFVKDGKHPVLAATPGVNFIPNSINLDKNTEILLITGPNMSGKSTYMRQIALIVIMAQIGCFVSCKAANLPVFRQIFTRIGASDDIISGESTFMVEMLEVNNALKYATSASLILFDEIGRGTATFDGLALAQAIIEYIHRNLHCKTLFSTHYHELTTLEETLDKLKNVHVSAEEVKGEIVFLHKVMPGPVDKSYGINVARLADLPLDIILRANCLLKQLEKDAKYDKEKLSYKNYLSPLVYDSKTEGEKEVISVIKDLDLDALTPLDALNLLNKCKNDLR